MVGVAAEEDGNVKPSPGKSSTMISSARLCSSWSPADPLVVPEVVDEGGERRQSSSRAVVLASLSAGSPLNAGGATGSSSVSSESEELGPDSTGPGGPGRVG